jgi:transcriptional regulator with XRE-family HTH domain
MPDIPSMLGDPDYSELASAFGRTLRRLRRGADLTQEQMAFEANLQRNYISMLELGRNQPTITTLFKLARVLNLTPEEMIVSVKSELNGVKTNL